MSADWSYSYNTTIGENSILNLSVFFVIFLYHGIDFLFTLTSDGLVAYFAFNYPANAQPFRFQDIF